MSDITEITKLHDEVNSTMNGGNKKEMFGVLGKTDIKILKEQGYILLEIAIDKSREDIAVYLLENDLIDTSDNRFNNLLIKLEKKYPTQQGKEEMTIKQIFQEKGKYEYKETSARKHIATIYNECTFNPKHETFIMTKKKPNDKDKKYIEVHHFLPKGLKKININEKEYDFSTLDVNLDVHRNMVSLCPNCHEIMHHAEPELQKEYVSKIYNYMINERKYGEWLERNNLDSLTENDFIKIYANYARQQKDMGGSDK